MAKAKALDIKKWLVAGAAGALAWLCIHKKSGVSGIGGVDWYHAVWVAQNELGIDFNKSYFEHSPSTMYELSDLGKRLGYRRSYDNGKSYGRAFFDALARRADKINAEMARYDR